VESTIVDLSGDRPRLLRPGHITRLDIEAVLQTELLMPMPAESSQMRAPGMMAVHYAPTTLAMRYPPSELCAGIQALTTAGKRIGVLTYRHPQTESPLIHVIRMPRQADDYAQALYASLRELDRLQLDMILVEQPPETAAWQAINDRLRKATIAFQM
jgi:L-threonylcarbamoyladenylate synthase